MGGFVPGYVESVFGVCGELLILMVGLVCGIIDMVFGCCVKRKYTKTNPGLLRKVAQDIVVLQVSSAQKRFPAI